MVFVGTGKLPRRHRRRRPAGAVGLRHHRSADGLGPSTPACAAQCRSDRSQMSAAARAPSPDRRLHRHGRAVRGRPTAGSSICPIAGERVNVRDEAALGTLVFASNVPQISPASPAATAGSTSSTSATRPAGDRRRHGPRPAVLDSSTVLQLPDRRHHRSSSCRHARVGDRRSRLQLDAPTDDRAVRRRAPTGKRISWREIAAVEDEGVELAAGGGRVPVLGAVSGADIWRRHGGRRRALSRRRARRCPGRRASARRRDSTARRRAVLLRPGSVRALEPTAAAEPSRARSRRRVPPSPPPPGRAAPAARTGTAIDREPRRRGAGAAAPRAAAPAAVGRAGARRPKPPAPQPATVAGVADRRCRRRRTDLSARSASIRGPRPLERHRAGVSREAAGSREGSGRPAPASSASRARSTRSTVVRSTPPRPVRRAGARGLLGGPVLARHARAASPVKSQITIEVKFTPVDRGAEASRPDLLIAGRPAVAGSGGSRVLLHCGILRPSIAELGRAMGEYGEEQGASREELDRRRAPRPVPPGRRARRLRRRLRRPHQGPEGARASSSRA